MVVARGEAPNGEAPSSTSALQLRHGFCRLRLGSVGNRNHADRRQGVLEPVGRAAVDGLLCDHVVAAAGEGLDDVGDRRRAGCHGKPRHASFEDRKQVKRALISVYDKTGLEDLARDLDKAGVEIVSTGSTAKKIAG